MRFPARDTDDDGFPFSVTPLFFTIAIALISISAGALGSLVGVGGGIIVVPALTLLMGVDIQHAIAASIISVIATSSGAASSYVRERITNIRLAMVMEIATALGALCGAFLAAVVSGRWLYLLFGVVLCYTAWSMSRKSKGHVREPVPDPWADRLKLHGSYFDRAEGREISYRVSRSKLGLVVSYVAGVVSGLLGIGGGVLKVPVMNLAMGLPIKVCTATSNFMIGVTAATSAAVYFMRGDIKPFIAAPVAVGVIIGAKIGARLLGRLKGNVIRVTFVAVLVISAVQMLWKGI
ncbi:putative permease [Opitutaceae bacterium TAV1]|nr:putative permease [Opitutaceae bacterium TAV1]